MRLVLAFTAIALSAPLVFGAATASAAVKEMHYDCTKAGNANKAACKGPAPMAMTAAKPAMAAPAAAPKPAAMAAASKSPAPASGGRVVAFTEKNGKTVHYDCSKAGNANKTACKS